jgi:hypothetical protein
MSVIHLILVVLVAILFILNVYQFLTQRAAVRIAEILYIMSRHVRDKAAHVKRESKDVEIIEAHLFGIATSARSLLRTLGRNESSLGSDPTIDLEPTQGNPKMDSESLLRLADNILFSVREENPTAEWDEIVDRALDKFEQRAPTLEREAVRRIMSIVVKQHKPNGTMAFAIDDPQQN